MSSFLAVLIAWPTCARGYRFSSIPAGGDDMRDAMGEDPRLAAACAGEDEQRAVTGLDRASLRWVEVGEIRRVDVVTPIIRGGCTAVDPRRTRGGQGCCGRSDAAAG